jgi:thioredoxin 2
MSQSIHAVCVECNATNRFALNQTNKELNCGRCHKPLFGTPPASVDASGFQAQITKSEVPVVVDFWAPWCGPCKAMAPAFEQVSLKMNFKARFIKVNTDAQPDLGSQYGIRSIPTLAIFRGGREVARTSGALPALELTRWIDSVVNQAEDLLH